MTATGLLRRHHDFRRLWLGAVVSQFGARVGQIATPLLAVTVLAAGPMQVGLLSAAQTAGLLVFGLPAGAWVDRMRRRPLMIAMDLVRAALLMTIPVAAWLGVLGLWQLGIVVLLVGVASVFFDVAYLSYLPSLIGREHLLQGNARLQAGQSVAVVAGPATGGVLAGLIGAANTLLATGVGFLASALALWRIHGAEAPPERAAKPSLRAEVAEGLRLVFGHPILRAIALCTSTANLFMSIALALNVLFLARVVGLPASAIGAVLAALGLGGVVGALVSNRVAARIGQVRVVWVALLATQPCSLLLPLAAPGWRVGLFAAGWFVVGLGSTLYNVAQVSLRQALCPDRLLGRMNATNRFVVWSTLPVGSVLGGLLGELLGIRGGLWLAGTGLSLAVLWLIYSPLRGMAELPEEAAWST